MSQKKEARKEDSQNFILKGFNSIQIGLYLIAFSFVLKSLIDGFLSDASMLGMMSIQIIEAIGQSLLFLFALLSGLAILFSSRRITRRLGVKFWSKQTSQQFYLFILLMIGSGGILYFLLENSYSPNLGVAFLALFALTIFLLNKSRKKSILLLGILSLLLAVICYLIPSYWYSSLLILGGAFFVYGVLIKK